MVLCAAASKRPAWRGRFWDLARRGSLSSILSTNTKTDLTSRLPFWRTTGLKSRTWVT
nr:MAG TPA_asm: hypothetical protein [Caudoviricetes sp.]